MTRLGIADPALVGQAVFIFEECKLLSGLPCVSTELDLKDHRLRPLCYFMNSNFKKWL